MSTSVALQPEPAAIVACTVSRDVQNFDLLIEDMETELGEGWGDLSFEDAKTFLGQPEAEQLEFIAIAVDEDDEDRLPAIGALIKSAKDKDIKVVLIAEELSPMALHQLLRLGADDFVPYPLPDGALHEAIERLKQPPPDLPLQPAEQAPSVLKSGHNREGVVLAVHGLSGGVGATTFAVNLAWELAQEAKDTLRVCLLDFDLQFGSCSTFLDLPRRDVIYEMWSSTSTIDSESFLQALLPFNEKLHVLTAPSDMLPLDLIGPEDVQAVIEQARANFDFVIIDMPSTLVQWTEVVLTQAQIYFALMELEMRSAQNALRFIRALKAEDLPVEKLRYIMNRAPKFTDLSGKSRVKRMAESLDIDIEVLLPEGGKQISQSGDHGLPLADTAGKSPLRKEIHKLAKSMHELMAEEETGN